MAWYKTGTITVTNGSTTVSGAGTAWISNAAIGEALYAPDGRLYEIVNIASDTTITLQSAYLGATASAQAYVIVPSQSYIRDLAAQAADLVNNYSTIYNTTGQGKFGDGTLGAPGIRFSDDLDTGFFRSASNEVTFVAGGTAIFKYNLTGGLSLTSGGDLVGTTATQTLTNKTLTSPTITGTGTAAFGNLSYTGTLTGGTGIINIGSGQVVKDASGNLGLGVTPSAWGSGKAIELGQVTGNALWGFGINSLYLTSNARWNGSNYVYTNNGAANLYGVGTGNGTHTWYTAPSGTAGNAISFTQAMTLDASGNLGVGTTAPFARLHVLTGSTYAANFYTTNTAAGTTRIAIGGLTTGASGGGGSAAIGAEHNHSETAQSSLTFYTHDGTNQLERARITSGGNFLIGTTNSSDTAGSGVKIIPGTNSYVSTVGADTTNSNSSYLLYSTGAAAYRFYVGYAGTVFATNTTITALSDQRLKENIQDIDVGLDAVMALKPRKFDWKEGKGKDIKGDRGWIAQEFEQVFPDMIDTWRDPAPEGEEPYKAVNANLIPVLVKAVQEQQAIIQSLTARLEALEAA